MTDAAASIIHDVSEEDALRAQVYDLLAVLMRKPPAADYLGRLAALTGDDSDLGRGINALARLAQASSPEKIDSEYHRLFIGLGRGELLPYASYYITGFLNEKPLAKLRGDMAELGMVKDAAAYEPEDNIGSLCEMMAGMIDGRFGNAVSLFRQKDFFFTHLAPWAEHFFSDLEAAEGSVFYAPVGTIGVQFMQIEKQSFRMAE
jgi:TorA maturation chaperone TorD